MMDHVLRVRAFPHSSGLVCTVMHTWNCYKAKNGLAFGIGLMSKENIGLCAGQVWSVRTAPKALKERDFQVK